MLLGLSWHYCLLLLVKFTQKVIEHKAHYTQQRNAEQTARALKIVVSLSSSEEPFQ